MTENEWKSEIRTSHEKVIDMIKSSWTAIKLNCWDLVWLEFTVILYLKAQNFILESALLCCLSQLHFLCYLSKTFI